MTDFMQYLIWRLSEAMGFAVGVGVLCAVACLSAFVLQRRKVSAASPFPWGRCLLAVVFSAYLAVVVSVTLLREETGGREINWHFFRAWREAWNSFSTKNWLNVLLNVVLFVPLGSCLPVLFPWFRRWHRILVAGFALSLLIEAVQLLTGLGLADVDDLAANTLGILLGVSVFQTLPVGNCRRTWLAVPAVFVLVLGAFFGYYAHKPYGNLPLAAAYRVDTGDYRWELEWEPNAEQSEAPVYQAESFDQAASDAFAQAFFAQLGVELHDSTRYGDSTYYANRNPGHFLFVNHGARNYTYSAVVENQEEGWVTGNADQVRQALEAYGVTVPEETVFTSEGDGWYGFALNRYSTEDGMFDGAVRCRLVSDGQVCEIEQFLQFYTYRETVAILSEQEALEQLQSGWFSEPGILPKIEKPVVLVHGVALEYRIDTKGFYVPVYVFDVSVNGDSLSGGLLIPAMQ